jgi:hypothetical protein
MYALPAVAHSPSLRQYIIYVLQINLTYRFHALSNLILIPPATRSTVRDSVLRLSRLCGPQLCISLSPYTSPASAVVEFIPGPNYAQRAYCRKTAEFWADIGRQETNILTNEYNRWPYCEWKQNPRFPCLASKRNLRFNERKISFLFTLS